MIKEAVEQELERAGWVVDYGFTGHQLIGSAGDLSIHIPWRDTPQIEAPPEYELYDAHSNVTCREVGVIPMPLRAGMLLEEHGEHAASVERELGWAVL